MLSKTGKLSILRFRENTNLLLKTFKKQEFKLLSFHKWEKMHPTPYFQTGLLVTKERLSLMAYSFFTQ
jgi:hypothetical protein